MHSPAYLSSPSGSPSNLHGHALWAPDLRSLILQCLFTMHMVCCAAAVFWIGLRRGWWVSLISYTLKLINSKGKPKSKKKKKKKQSQQKKKARSSRAAGSEDGLEESGLVASGAATTEAGAAASAKVLFSKMKMKMTGNTAESADETAERECLPTPSQQQQLLHQ